MALVAGVGVYVIGLSPGDKPPPRPERETIDAARVLRVVTPLMNAGRYVEAVSTMRAYVRSAPNDSEVRPLLAKGLVKLNRPDEAELVVDDCLRLSPRIAEALWLKGDLVRRRAGERYAFFYDQAARCPDAGGEIWARYGLELFDGGQDEAAEEYLRKAADAGARDARTLAALGELALRKGSLDQAEALLGEAIALEAGNARSRAALASALRQSGKIDMAEKTLREGLEARPDGGLFVALAELMQARKKTLEAADAFAAASRYPDYRASAALEAAKCYCGLDRYALAMEMIDRAAAERPEDGEVVKWKKTIEDRRFGDGRE